MDWINFLGYGLTAIIIGLIMTYLNKSGNKEIDRNDIGQIELRMHRLYFYGGLVCVIFALVFVGAAIYVNEIELYFIGFAMLLLFGGLGILCLLPYKNHWIAFDDNTISVYNWAGKKKTIQWNKIENIKFSSVSGYIKIRTPDDTVSIHQHLVGLNMFIKKMEALTSWREEDLKIPFRGKH